MRDGCSDEPRRCTAVSLSLLIAGGVLLLSALLSAFEREVIPGEPDTPAAELAADLSNVPPHRHVSIGLATEAGQPAGAIPVYQYSDANALDTAKSGICGNW